MPLVVGCPRRGPPPRPAGRAQRPPPPHSVAPKRASSSSSSTTPPLLTTRRAASAASLLLAALPPFPASSPQLPVASAKEDDEAEAREGEGELELELELELERYTDRDEGFTLLKPVSWPKVEKAGATALFQQEGKGSNNIGIVVNPVRLSTLTEFGTPQFVAERLIQAEKKKIQDNMDVAAHIRKLFRLKVHTSIDEHPKYSALITRSSVADQDYQVFSSRSDAI
ncbi:Os04g0434900 [Oryza sativa Japonica Group]|uniref:OSJNBb0086G13.11 protein n=1 Tax=Oryza sativa subsp. japonica TaxID=39947 RepID=Q7XUS9_ORYSJ|nr:Os04g0434900 [Oryza sativa Japonica Group]CAD41020.1 OSJNBb0086G13.11 [Oryza sativa Japonica Group]|eukprot:NP_001052845.1 Os04g0434900 [Oryza sativa Japonica Group]